MKNRPSQKPTGTPMPKHMRWLKQGVMIFELTKAQRAKLVLGFNAKVTVNIAMQHNPGVFDVQAQLDVTEQTEFKPGDQIAPLTLGVTLEKAPEAKEGGK